LLSCHVAKRRELLAFSQNRLFFLGPFASARVFTHGPYPLLGIDAAGVHLSRTRRLGSCHQDDRRQAHQQHRLLHALAPYMETIEVHS
jgi:hypothetical protein